MKKFIISLISMLLGIKNRKTKSMYYNNSKSMLILFNCNCFNIIEFITFINTLKTEQKEITVLLFNYIQGGKNNYLTDKNINFYIIDDKSINLFGSIKNENVKTILKQNFDIMFVFDMNTDYLVYYFITLFEKVNLLAGSIEQFKRIKFNVVIKAKKENYFIDYFNIFKMLKYES